jgi:monofunctional biosynthetic peptidoglycan transglycosylase
MAKRSSRSRKKGSTKKALGKGLIVCLKLFCLLLIFSILQVLILKMVDPPMTTRMAFQWVEIKLGTEAGPMPRYQWRPLKNISMHLARAVLAAEDQRFLAHHGFDFIEMNDALQDMVAGERLRGASTISMQAARSVFLWQSRSWLRKSLEAYYTVLIELIWGKKRILEIYLNTADWGHDMVGAEAAAEGYFRKKAATLGPEEGAMLAAILPSPHHWSPLKPSAYLRERQKKILRDMKSMKVP